MNKKVISIIAAAVIVCGGLFAYLFFNKESIVSGKILSIIGLVEVQKKDAKTPVKVFADMAFTEGDVLFTRSDGRVELAIDDNKHVEVAEDTELAFTELVSSTKAAQGKTYLHLQEGKVKIKIDEKLKGDSKFQIETPDAIMGVMGTEFYVFVDEDGTWVGVIEGQVNITTPSGEQITMVPGDRSVFISHDGTIEERELSSEQEQLFYSSSVQNDDDVTDVAIENKGDNDGDSDGPNPIVPENVPPMPPSRLPTDAYFPNNSDDDDKDTGSNSGNNVGSNSGSITNNGNQTNDSGNSGTTTENATPQKPTPSIPGENQTPSVPGETPIPPPTQPEENPSQPELPAQPTEPEAPIVVIPPIEEGPPVEEPIVQEAPVQQQPTPPAPAQPSQPSNPGGAAPIPPSIQPVSPLLPGQQLQLAYANGVVERAQSQYSTIMNSPYLNSRQTTSFNDLYVEVSTMNKGNLDEYEAKARQLEGVIADIEVHLNEIQEILSNGRVAISRADELLQNSLLSNQNKGELRFAYLTAINANELNITEYQEAIESLQLYIQYAEESINNLQLIELDEAINELNNEVVVAEDFLLSESDRLFSEEIIELNNSINEARSSTFTVTSDVIIMMNSIKDKVDSLYEIINARDYLRSLYRQLSSGRLILAANEYHNYNLTKENIERVLNSEDRLNINIINNTIEEMYDEIESLEELIANKISIINATLQKFEEYTNLNQDILPQIYFEQYESFRDELDELLSNPSEYESEIFESKQSLLDAFLENVRPIVSSKNLLAEKKDSLQYDIRNSVTDDTLIQQLEALIEQANQLYSSRQTTKQEIDDLLDTIDTFISQLP